VSPRQQVYPAKNGLFDHACNTSHHDQQSPPNGNIKMAIYRIQIGNQPSAGPPPGLLSRIALGFTAGLALVGSLFLGALIFLVVAGVIAAVSLLLFIRVWWFKRQFARAVRQQEQTEYPGASGRTADPNVIDVEYTEKDADKDS